MHIRFVTRKSAPITGLRWSRTTRAPTTAMKAMMEKMRICTSSALRAEAERDEASDPEDVRDRQGNQHLPAEVHELVVPEPGQGPADPHEQEEEEPHLEHERQDRGDGERVARDDPMQPRHLPAPQKEGDEQGGGRRHV